MVTNVFSFLLMIMTVSMKLNATDVCDGTTDICVNYNRSAHTLLENQVHLEMEASYIYQIYGTYFDRSDIALPGFTEYMLRESLHEHTHADNLLRYINQRGGRSTFRNINISDICDKITNRTKGNSCFCHHVVSNKALDCINETDIKKVGLWALEDALGIELLVMKELMNIVATSKNDHQLTHYIEHEYLDEQIQTIKRLGSFIGQLNRFGDNEYFIGEYSFDKNLYRKVKKMIEMDAKHSQKARISSHYQWHEEKQEYDSLYI